MSDPGPRLYHSITLAGSEAAGAVVVCGSHGGMFVGALAARLCVRAIVLCDAGGGLEDAGVSGVLALADAGIAAAAVGHVSARIGDAEDMLARGRISRANRMAADLGVTPGMRVRDAAAVLQKAPAAVAAFREIEESRRILRLASGIEAVLIDSVSLLVPQDRGRVVVTGSHGGLVGGAPGTAAKVDAGFLAFSDAGIGADAAGLGRLPVLAGRGIPAVTVGHETARIGDAGSIHATGIVSAVNAPAQALGFAPGTPLGAALESVAWPGR